MQFNIRNNPYKKQANQKWFRRLFEAPSSRARDGGDIAAAALLTILAR
jgi:hypothetical protein